MRKNNNYAYQYYYLAKMHVGVTSLKGYLGLYVSSDSGTIRTLGEVDLVESILNINFFPTWFGYTRKSFHRIRMIKQLLAKLMRNISVTGIVH